MITKELCVAQRKYTDKNGNEKTVWLKIGEIHEHNGKTYGVVFPHINLAALPRKEGEDRVFFNLFDPLIKPNHRAAHRLTLTTSKTIFHFFLTVWRTTLNRVFLAGWLSTNNP